MKTQKLVCQRCKKTDTVEVPRKRNAFKSGRTAIYLCEKCAPGMRK